MLEFDHVSVAYNGRYAVKDLRLALEPGELLTLLGPSGCGKSTLIRAAAGFLETEGIIRIQGQDMSGVPPEKRPTATVFQSHALFPHLSVRGNVGYGLRARGVTGRERDQRADAMLERVGLAGFGERRVQDLSGGQQQRVALARALILNPAVLLLDEPLSSLDAALRVQMRREIRTLQQELRQTALYVTHDQEEALSISDRVAVMRAGHIEQLGAPEQVYRRPSTEFTASFVSHANLVPEQAYRLLLPYPSGENAGRSRVFSEENAQATRFVRPEEVRLAPDPSGAWLIRERQFRGAATGYLLQYGDFFLRVDAGSAEADFWPGERVRATLREMEEG